MRRRSFIAGTVIASVAAAAFLVTAGSANAQYRPGPPPGPGRHVPDRPGTWALLGSQSVGFRVDRDIVRVGRQDGRFRAVKLRALGNDIELFDVKVVYGNGEVDRFPVRHFMRKNTETRAIDLRGNTRFIKEVHLTYKSRPNFRGRATVEVWGQH